LSCLFLVTASRMRACARDTASRLCVRNVLCSSAFSFPAPSLHGRRSGQGRFVRSLPRYFGQVRLLHRAHRRLRPPAFPTTSRPRLAGTAMEISRFPCKRLLRMPGSTTTRGRHVSRDIDTGRIAFCGTKTSAPRTCLTPLNTSPAPSPVNASRLPSRTTRASLAAGTVRCSFTVTDFHRLPFAGLPAHLSTHDPFRTSPEPDCRISKQTDTGRSNPIVPSFNSLPAEGLEVSRLPVPL
jgi:hypothetical protein